MQVREKLIILKSIKYGESDLVLQCISSEGEKVSLIAKGALRSRKRFGGGVLEPTHYIEALFKKKPNDCGEQSLGLLQEAQIIDAFTDLRKDYDRLQFALFIVQTILRFVKEGDISAELFHLTGNALKAACSSQNLSLLKAHFEIKLLHQQGVLPRDIGDTTKFNKSLARHEEIEITAERLRLLNMRVQNELSAYLSA